MLNVNLFNPPSYHYRNTMTRALKQSPYMFGRSYRLNGVHQVVPWDLYTLSHWLAFDFTACVTHCTMWEMEEMSPQLPDQSTKQPSGDVKRSWPHPFSIFQQE